MDKVKSWSRSILAAALFSLSTSCSQNANQTTAIIRPIGDGDISIDDISEGVVNLTGMIKSTESFEYGGKNGALKAILLTGGRSSVLLRAISNDECAPMEGDHSPNFSHRIFSVTIVRTSIIPPRFSNSDLLNIIRKSAAKHKAKLVSEIDKCKQDGSAKRG